MQMKEKEAVRGFIGPFLYGGAEENHERIAYILDEVRIEHLSNTGQKYYR
jgi:hypothetical protein